MSQVRLRITFAKGPELKYISHLDLALLWERALRRAGVPLAHSQGHNPQAKIRLASGLPLGYIAAAEVMDIILTEAVSRDDFTTQLRSKLPRGLTIVSVEEASSKSPSLQSVLRQAVYRVIVETPLSADELTGRIDALLAADHLVQQRNRKGRTETFDLRPLVSDVWLEATGDNHAVLLMRLSAGQHGNVRPDAVAAALGLGDAHTQIERMKLLFEFDSL